MIREDLQQAAERLCEKRDKWFDEQERKEQEPKYCDRNICLRNEYNGIGCDECEVTKSQEQSGDTISRQALLKLMGEEPFNWTDSEQELQAVEDYRNFRNMVEQLPSVKPQEPKTDKYEYHTDHTDCIWYGNDSGCPVTCSQYRDGWNDAMDYIFKNGKGYQPYRHDG